MGTEDIFKVVNEFVVTKNLTWIQLTHLVNASTFGLNDFPLLALFLIIFLI